MSDKARGGVCVDGAYHDAALIKMTHSPAVVEVALYAGDTLP